MREVARQLDVWTQTICRWLAEGLLLAERIAAHAPWRIRLTDEIRQRFVPDIPDGYVRLADAARQLGVARQTVLNEVRAGHRHAIHVINGKRRGLRIQLHPKSKDYWTHPTAPTNPASRTLFLLRASRVSEARHSGGVAIELIDRR